MSFKTTEAYISGAICGDLWMPAVLGGIPFRANLRGSFGIMDRFTEPVNFRDALDLLLSEKGGDFQNAKFSADTRMTVVRRRVDGAGRYTLHVWERELVELSNCADLVNQEAYTGDFFGDEN
jgi:hypothetical protein